MKISIWFTISFVVLAIGAANLAAQNDSVFLGNGSTKVGKIIAIAAEGVRFQENGAAESELVIWPNVVTLKSEGAVEIPLATGEKVIGKIAGVEQGVGVTVEGTSFGTVRVPMAGLIADKPPEKTDKPPEKKTLLTPKEWYGHVALSASLATGNSDVFQAILDVEAGRIWEENELLLKLRAVYGESNGSKDTDAQTIVGRFAHHYNEDLYSYAQLELGRDDIKNIELRLLPNIGAGYKVYYEDDDHLFSLEGGIGMRYESFTDGTESRTEPTVRAAAIFHEVFFDDIKFRETAEIIVPVTEPGAFLARSETVVSVPVSLSWSVRATLLLEYQADPPSNRKALDTLATIGLEYKF